MQQVLVSQYPTQINFIHKVSEKEDRISKNVHVSPVTYTNGHWQESNK